MGKYLIIIPARLKSTRFPGKVLKKINNKTLIEYVFEKCEKVTQRKNIYVATEDNEIVKFCKEKKINYFLNQKKCLTGTDRIPEIAKLVKRDFYFNVQADEIFFSISALKKIIKTTIDLKKYVTNGMTQIKSSIEFNSLSVPKVVTDNKNFLLYMSRSPIPGNKNKKFISGYKQVCIYGFPRNQILNIIKIKKKTKNERIEDIEILRFLDIGTKIKMIPVNGSKLAIDTNQDFEKAKIILNKLIR